MNVARFKRKFKIGEAITIDELEGDAPILTITRIKNKKFWAKIENKKGKGGYKGKEKFWNIEDYTYIPCNFLMFG